MKDGTHRFLEEKRPKTGRKREGEERVMDMKAEMIQTASVGEH
jgi:hypothetical protein